MNKYRVDRASSKRTPCGMVSALYIGDDWAEARRIYDAADTGLDPWGEPNAAYGVLVSVWNERARDYVVKMRKGLD